MNKTISEHFMFATGIENSYPTIQLPGGVQKRIDEMEKTNHYKYWKTDFKLLELLGVTHLRYGPPYYNTHIGPDQYDWDFSEHSFVTALKHCCKAGVMAMHAILKVQPNAIFIQSESSEYFHPSEPSAQKMANFLNEKRFLSLDLTYGYPLSATMYQNLLANGMPQEEYQWFGDNQVNVKCIMCNDYYITNEHLVFPDESTKASGEIFGYYVNTHQYYSRYHLPIMHTETNIATPNCINWLYESPLTSKRLVKRKPYLNNGRAL